MMHKIGWLILCFFFQLAFGVVVCAQYTKIPQKADIVRKSSRYEEGDIRQIDFHINSISLLKSQYPYLQGNGITICQKEHSPDPADIDLMGRLLPSSFSSTQTTPHASTVATLMTGAGYSSPLSEGIAPQAKLISVSFDRNLPESPAFYQRNRITIVNHSYGTAVENFYGENAAAYDKIANQMPALVAVFSSGNLGNGVSQSGKYAGIASIANLTGNSKMSKNSLAVGAINAIGETLPSSSRGPAYDGRIKPELVAYGEDGTSGAAAMVSGVTALLQELFEKATKNEMPSALLKAALINSAEDVGSAGIDYQNGYGNLNAFEAARTIEEKKYVEAIISNGGSFELPIEVKNAQKLKITLVWNDPVAAQDAPQALVNDLDLDVSDGQYIWQPWVLSTFPHLDSLRKAPQRGRDALNNVEQVTIDNPVPTVYTIRVKGAKLATGKQTFYIVYQWSTKDQFSWVSPNAKAPVGSDATFVLRWKSTIDQTTAKLDFSSDEGQTWSLVSDGIDLKAEKYAWKSPNHLANGQFRMSINEKPYLSQPFVISSIPAVSVLYSCSDSLGFSWQTTVPQSLHYNLYQFDEQQPGWKKINTLDRQQVVVKGIQPKDVFAIEPVTAEGIVGLKSNVFNGLIQQVACYYKNVQANLINEEVAIVCELSTTDGMKSITFQKQTPQGIQNVAVQSVITDNQFYIAYDTALQDGPNRYRVMIALENGSVSYSDFTTLIVANKVAFLVYPNPIAKDARLKIHAKEYGTYTVRLIDYMGRFVSEDEFNSTEHEISVRALNSGLYFYTILQEGRPLQSGKIIVQ